MHQATARGPAQKLARSSARSPERSSKHAAKTPPVVGMPRYLGYRIDPGDLAGPQVASAEEQARDYAEGRSSVVAPSSGRQDSLAHTTLRAASRGLGGGRPVPNATRARHERRLNTDLSDVRLHTDSRAAALADGVGANAYALGRDVYFGTGRYEPGAESGERLLAHEMAHVAQHGASDGEQLHADLRMSLPVSLGVFGIDMVTRVAPATPGMSGHITFDPDPSGPYSAEIGLIQAVRLEAGGVTSGIGSTLGFAGPAEAERDILATTGGSGEEAGWHVDTTYADPAKTQGSQTSPSYPESVGFSPGNNEHGFLRSPTDVGQARLFDAPRSPRPQINFDFETVARGMDSQTVYGGLHWGFEITGSAVDGSSEYAFTTNGTSAEFDASLDRFRTYFTHEPTIIYFGTAGDTPAAGEDFKLDEATTWLTEFPDAQVEIEGFADEVGSTALNAGLSQRRADSVAGGLMARGLDPTRITSSIGRGETDAFAAGGEAGQLQANRRARIRFVRTASTTPGP